MAAANAVPSFDDIIQADRLRRKNEALANEIFGKGRRASTPTIGGKRKPGTGPSLASRVGVTKPSQRSASSTPKVRANIEKEWLHDLHEDNSSRLTQAAHEPKSLRVPANNNHSIAAIQRRSPITQPTSRLGGNGMTIRGLAGPYVVIASNFAPGTTGADIESAMIPIGGEMLSCKILTASPTVIAEMVFTEKVGAENVISTFNNQKADGRLLNVYMKGGAAVSTPAFSAVAAAPPRSIPTEPRNNRQPVTRAEPSYSGFGPERNGRRADPEFQDGSYGFEAREEKMDIDMDDRRDDTRDGRRIDRRESGRGRDTGRERDNRGLYSDDLYTRSRGRGFR
ncbi:hypothetical protein MMC30_000475 [Trapelia coarctata]|nr:hypothetical protein [Trapelia coarctata]